MAHKTITVSETAYEALKELKREHESFTQVILRITGKKASKISEILSEIVWDGPVDELIQLEKDIQENRNLQRLRELGP
ncbi:MAG: antitoxin VapB family protein [Candidatus Heimdallarchaeota archaeon]